MAQVKLKWCWFELNWRPRLVLAARLLRGFQDRWLRSEGPFPSREVVAVLLNVFAFDFYKADLIRYEGISADELSRRSLDEWIDSVDSPQAECRRLHPNRQDSECDAVVESFCAGLSNAAESWERNASDAMTCEELVRWMVDELVARRFAIVKYD
ncbi:MAG: hypothetical protein ACJ8F7_02710 [Gemmataceae bacterium]